MTVDTSALEKLITNNTNWKHFEELKRSHLTACGVGVHEARNVVSTKQLRKNYHQQHSPAQECTYSQSIFQFFATHSVSSTGWDKHWTVFKNL